MCTHTFITQSGKLRGTKINFGPKICKCVPFVVAVELSAAVVSCRGSSVVFSVGAQRTCQGLEA